MEPESVERVRLDIEATIGKRTGCDHVLSTKPAEKRSRSFGVLFGFLPQPSNKLFRILWHFPLCVSSSGQVRVLKQSGPEPTRN